MKNVGSRYLKVAVVLARIALAAAFLSSIADRFGVWGKPGAPGVTWGEFQRFITQIEAMLPIVPRAAAPILAWVVTVLESVFGLSLLVGLRTRTMGLGAACLLIVFAVFTAQSPAGIHAVLASSVLSAAGAALLLSTTADEI
jgi:uncharacterized membrane protein YphA (DoxX/SURF4 family)